MSDSNSIKPQKQTRKRNRVPISCVICRRRKVKCDKQKPQCSNCIKNNVQHLCHYLEPKWARPLESEILTNQMPIKSEIRSQNQMEIQVQNKMLDQNQDPDQDQLREQNQNFVDNNIIPLKSNIDENSITVDPESIRLRNELKLLKEKLKTLEDENSDLRKKATINSTKPNLNNTATIRSSKIQDQDDVLDAIFNSNILFIAKKGNQYNIPITYQISVFSWMFMVKNDLYLNDLWMKILKLRQHYEYYYNSRGTNEKNMISHYRNYDNKLKRFKNSNLRTSVISQDKTNEHTSKLKKFLEKSLNLEKDVLKLNKFKNSNEIEVEVSSPKVQPQLPNVCPVTGVVGVCPMGNSITKPFNIKQEGTGYENKFKASNIETVENSDINNKNIGDLHDKDVGTKQIPLTLKRKKSHKKDTSTLSVNKCPVLHPNESKLNSIQYTRKFISNGLYEDSSANTTDNNNNNNNSNKDKDSRNDDSYSDSDDHLEDPKVCPLMVGDTKAFFKEKLSKNNISALRDSYHYLHKRKANSASPAKNRGNPIIPSSPSTPMSEIKPEDTDKLNNFVPIAMKPGQSTLSSRQNSMKRQSSFHDYSQSTKSKKAKTISSSAIKSLNYNNTKQVVSIIEQYLPSKKIVGLLIDRFFDKLYIYMPYVDEQSFRIQVNALMKSSDVNSQKIKLNSIGTQYCEDFLTLCLLLVIIRLSWLSLPDKVLDGLSQNELLLMKPDNFVTFVLVDMVKEVFCNTKIMAKPSIIIFQVGLYLKIYSTISPEDGFDTDDSYTKNSTAPNVSADSGTPGTPGTQTSTNSNDLPPDLTNESPNMNSPNFIAMLVDLARTIGLNRDPLNFKNFYPTPNDDEITISRLFKKRHLWRKLWYGLVHQTIEANLSLGDYKKGLPIEIDLDPSLGNAVNSTWDCRLPGGIEQGVLEKSYENGKILQKELCVVQNFRDSITSYRWIFKGMSLLYAVDKPPITLEIENIINKLNEIVSEKSKYGFGIDLIMGDQEIANPFRARNSSVWVKKYTKQIKVSRLKLHLIAKNMIFALNYFLFLNHEQKLSKLLGQKNSSIEKIKKQRSYIESFFESSLLSAIDNFKLFVQFMDESNKVFTNCSAELLIYPFLMILNHRSHEFLISLVLRIQQSSPVIMEILKKNKIDPKELQKRLFTYLETFIERLDGLTKNYYYAWVLKRLVKFFFNILTNSQKFFKINFKKINAAQNVTTGKQTNTDDNIDNKSNGEKSAFEIAFGTSKLPPVTDFTHDDRREINFNPIVSNSEVLLTGGNPAMNFGINNTNSNINNNNNSKIYFNNINSFMANSENYNNGRQNNSQTVNTLTSRLFDDMASSINFGNQHTYNNNLSPVLSNVMGIGADRNTTGDFNLHTARYGTKHIMNKWDNGMGGELNELFDDQFFNEISGVPSENSNHDGLFGLNRDINSEFISPSPTIADVPNMAEFEGVSISNGTLRSAVLNQTTNGIMNFNSFTSDKGEMYNSLNEIDFTNVDLNTQVDNIVYGLEFNMPENTKISKVNEVKNNTTPVTENSMNRNENSGANPNGNQGGQYSGLGHWDFF